MILRSLSNNTLVLTLLFFLGSCSEIKKSPSVVLPQEKTVNHTFEINQATLQKVVPGLQSQEAYYEAEFLLEKKLPQNVLWVAVVYNNYRGQVKSSDILDNKIKVVLNNDQTLVQPISRPLTIFYIEDDVDKTYQIEAPTLKNDLYRP